MKPPGQMGQNSSQPGYEADDNMSSFPESSVFHHKVSPSSPSSPVAADDLVPALEPAETHSSKRKSKKKKKNRNTNHDVPHTSARDSNLGAFSSQNHVVDGLPSSNHSTLSPMRPELIEDELRRLEKKKRKESKRAARLARRELEIAHAPDTLSSPPVKLRPPSVERQPEASQEESMGEQEGLIEQETTKEIKSVDPDHLDSSAAVNEVPDALKHEQATELLDATSPIPASENHNRQARTKSAKKKRRRSLENAPSNLDDVQLGDAVAEPTNRHPKKRKKDQPPESVESVDGEIIESNIDHHTNNESQDDHIKPRDDHIKPQDDHIEPQDDHIERQNSPHLPLQDDRATDDPYDINMLDDDVSQPESHQEQRPIVIPENDAGSGPEKMVDSHQNMADNDTPGHEHDDTNHVYHDSSMAVSGRENQTEQLAEGQPDASSKHTPKASKKGARASLTRKRVVKKTWFARSPDSTTNEASKPVKSAARRKKPAASQQRDKSREPEDNSEAGEESNRGDDKGGEGRDPKEPHYEDRKEPHDKDQEELRGEDEGELHGEDQEELHDEAEASPEALGNDQSIQKPEKHTGFVIFSPREDARIQRAIERWGRANGKTQSQVNALIHVNPQRDKTATDLWDNIHQVCSDRPRKKVLLACRRKYHNFVARGSWTPEQHEELARLVDMHGQRYAKLGELINRHPEDVRDRVRNYVICGDKLKKQYWGRDEEERLKEVVTEALVVIRRQRESGEIVGNGPDEDYIQWQKVSELLGRSRSRKQCIDKWKLVKELEEMNGYNAIRKKISAARAQLETLTPEHLYKIVREVEDGKAKTDKGIPWARVESRLKSEADWNRPLLMLAWNRLKQTVSDWNSMPLSEIAQVLISQYKKTKHLELADEDDIDMTVEQAEIEQQVTKLFKKRSQRKSAQTDADTTAKDGADAENHSHADSNRANDDANQSSAADEGIDEHVSGEENSREEIPREGSPEGLRRNSMDLSAHFDNDRADASRVAEASPEIQDSEGRSTKRRPLPSKPRILDETSPLTPTPSRRQPKKGAKGGKKAAKPKTPRGLGKVQVRDASEEIEDSDDNKADAARAH